MNNLSVPSQEIRFGLDCLLFEACNLNCKFCLEAHTNRNIDLTWIRSIPERMLERFKAEHPKFDKVKYLSIRLWGGELFFDQLDDSLFDEYNTLITTFKNLFKTEFPNMELIFSFVTNGVFTKRDRVKNLLLNTNSQVNISYDPVGRFHTQKQEQTMLANADYFNDLGLLSEISITLTKPCIKAYINNQSKLLSFKKYNKIDLNYYVANPNWKELLPNDDDIFNFFKYVIDNDIYNIIDVEHLVQYYYFPDSEKELICNCDRHLSACKNSITFNCVKAGSIFPNEDFYGEQAQNITEDNVSDIKKHLGLLKRGCLLCKFYNICPRPCWTALLYKNYRLTQCPYQQVFKYLSEHPEIKERYSKWKF